MSIYEMVLIACGLLLVISVGLILLSGVCEAYGHLMNWLSVVLQPIAWLLVLGLLFFVASNFPEFLGHVRKIVGEYW